MAMAPAPMQAISADLTGHGGRLDTAARLYPHAPRPWLDLSTGINPNPWMPPPGLAVDPGPLPTREDLRALEAVAARFFGVAPARVAAVPGSEIALRLLPALGLPRPIASLSPTYATHGEIADLRVTTLDSAAAGTLLLANPNNPDGRILPPARMKEVAGAGRFLVVDEAFADISPAASLLPGLASDAPVVVLRSFGKFFGLAGVRLGFVVAPDPVLARLRASVGDWPVSTHAIAWGRAAYADEPWIAATRADLADRAARLDTLLARHGLAAEGACPLFRLVTTPDAPALFDRLARAGILVRPFADRPDWLRFGLPGDDDAFVRLDRALTHG